MIPRFKLCVFDWDGTMMDTTDAIVQSIRTASQILGLTPPTEAKTKRAIGLGRVDTMKFLLPDCPKERWSEFETVYRSHYLEFEKEIPLIDGMRELILKLRKAGVKTALATGKSERGVNRVLSAHNLKGYFDAIRVGAVINPKPAPGMLLEICEELCISQADTVMIGDSTLDLQMASNAGTSGIGVTFGACTETELNAFPNVGLAEDAHGLERLLFSD